MTQLTATSLRVFPLTSFKVRLKIHYIHLHSGLIKVLILLNYVNMQFQLGKVRKSPSGILHRSGRNENKHFKFQAVISCSRRNKSLTNAWLN